MRRWREVAALAFRAGCGSVLLWAGIAKALDRQGSILTVDAYNVLPTGLVRPVATALPWIEIAIGVFLVLGLFVRFSGIGTAALTLVFVAALGQAKARGLPIDCGCFGGGGPGTGVGWFDIVRDLPLLAGGIFLALWPGQRLQLDRLLTRDETKEEWDGPRASGEGREEDHGADVPPPKAVGGRAASRSAAS
jgi:uncharacterized membrane protein YphA (DoxX/SURF4 family)